MLAAQSLAPGSEKSPQAFRTISEVAVELDVPQHVLRFWEQRFTQVKPVKRGGNRRYYRPEDVDLLRGIRTLLYSDGFTIKGVQKLIREQGVRYVAGLGRTDSSLIGTLSADMPLMIEAGVELGPTPDEARTAIVAVKVALPLAQTAPLDEERRVSLELLLAELLHLKAKLRGGPQRLMAAE